MSGKEYYNSMLSLENIRDASLHDSLKSAKLRAQVILLEGKRDFLMAKIGELKFEQGKPLEAKKYEETLVHIEEELKKLRAQG